MTKTENNCFAMFRASHATLVAHIADFTRIPVLLEAVEKLGTMINLIVKLDSSYQTIAKGATTAKNLIKEELLKETDSHCSSLCIYGNRIANWQLKESCDVSGGPLTRLRENELLGKAKEVVDLLTVHAPNLTNYGITAQEITEYSDLVKSFDDAINTRDTRSTSATVAREELSDAFGTTRRFLSKEMDKLVKKVKKRNPNLFSKYELARQIKDLGVRHAPPVTPPPPPPPKKEPTPPPKTEPNPASKAEPNPSSKEEPAEQPV